MIKTLQRKFVVTAMIAITVLLLFLIGVILLEDATGRDSRSERS